MIFTVGKKVIYRNDTYTLKTIEGRKCFISRVVEDGTHIARSVDLDDIVNLSLVNYKEDTSIFNDND